MSSAKGHLAGPAPVHQLAIKASWDSLTGREKRYAHHMSRAAWHGARVIMRQTSPESIPIYEFLLKLNDACGGSWRAIPSMTGVTDEDMDHFLDYAATFLSNVGNYYGTGDQKFVPNVSSQFLKRIAAVSPELSAIYESVAVDMTSSPPYSLGLPGENAQSAYYSGLGMTEIEIRQVSDVLEQNGIYPENTRFHKGLVGENVVYRVDIASVQPAKTERKISIPNSKSLIVLVYGDHSEQLRRICDELREASKYTRNPTQEELLGHYIESFESGDIEEYKQSQRTWVKDLNPRIENIFGFVEPYRDPHGTKAEFEGLVAISNPDETALLTKLVEHSAKFIRRLPWAQNATENDGKGPFEKSFFEAPDFTSIHSLAYCSSIIFPGINLPNFNDIRQEDGFKNVIIANRMSTESNVAELCPYIHEDELHEFHAHKYPAYYGWVVLHELLGHGTGKMMIEEREGKFNFDPDDRPIDPLTGKPISSWYRPGQTWTGQFADIATTVDECRAELVGAYLMDDVELLGLLGYNQNSEHTPQHLTYNLYLQLGVDGLRGLQNFNVEDQRWGQAHSRAHFAILKCLLKDGNGFMEIDFNATENSVKVRVDRSRIVTDGKPALGRMLLKLHMYRCTADVSACRAYYEDLSAVHGIYLDWRRAVLAKAPPKWVFVQANTFLQDGNVILKEYPASKEGVIQSWAERAV